MFLQLVSVLHFSDLNKLYDLSILVGQVQHRNSNPTSVSLFQPVYLACQSSDTWAHLGVCLQHSSFDGGVWLTLVIDGTNTNQKSFAWTFPVWPGFTSDFTWQTQCVTPSLPLHSTFISRFSSLAEPSYHALLNLLF